MEGLRCHFQVLKSSILIVGVKALISIIWNVHAVLNVVQKNDEYQNMTCFDDSFLANYDGDWERNYDREAYYFSKDDTDLQFLPNGRRLDGVDF
mmetsp:Transcript_13271/g.18794  ORF Transcript_13271/g.18794 Transcript_13271/m.18794 type:complete len:94 (-) Transcript_13271:110-391(-)